MKLRCTDSEFWSAYATFRDHGGTTIVAWRGAPRRADDWFLDDAYYGN
ncbi:MAG: hypothetical protein ABI467_07515 [Kofleriaceae bacterium]